MMLLGACSDVRHVALNAETHIDGMRGAGEGHRAISPDGQRSEHSATSDTLSHMTCKLTCTKAESVSVTAESFTVQAAMLAMKHLVLVLACAGLVRALGLDGDHCEEGAADGRLGDLDLRHADPVLGISARQAWGGLLACTRFIGLLNRWWGDVSNVM